MSSRHNAIEIRNLTVAYDLKPVLWNINLDIPKGSLMAIVGPNGAGKSTLIKSILNFIPRLSGHITYYDESSHTIKNLKNKIGYVPQNGSVDWDFPATVLDIVLMGTYGRLGWLRKPSKADINASLQALEQVGMREFSERQINNLSGGQQQRVFLARAFVQNADIYFMDEPLKGVDIETEKTIMSLLKKLRDDGKTILVVHHALQTIPEYFDYVTFVNKKVIASGFVSKVFNEDIIQATYQQKLQTREE